jgi:hypothetical protein
MKTYPTVHESNILEWSRMFSSKKGYNHLKQDILISTIPWVSFLSMTQNHFSLTYYRPALQVCPPLPFLYSGTPPPHPPSFRLAHTIFEPNLFLYKYSNNLVSVIIPAYTTYEDGTECSKTSAHKI